MSLGAAGLEGGLLALYGEPKGVIYSWAEPNDWEGISPFIQATSTFRLPKIRLATSTAWRRWPRTAWPLGIRLFGQHGDRVTL